MQVRDTPHQTVTFSLCRGFWCSCCRFSVAQYRKFCLFTIPDKWMWTSSLVIKTISSVSNSNIVSVNLCRLMKSFCSSFWTIIILYGWKWRSKCKILRTDLSDIWRAGAWRTAERRGLACIACRTLNVFWGPYSSITSPCSPWSQRFCSLKTIFTHFIMVFRFGTRPWRPTLKWFRNRRVRTTERPVSMKEL